jgi:hypothetical protein
MLRARTLGGGGGKVRGQGRIGRALGVIAVMLIPAGHGALGQQLSAPPGFLAELNANFKQWDTDGDGSISFDETSRLVPDNSVRDAAAATVAALHLAQRGNTWRRQAFSRDRLFAPASPGGASAPPFPLYYEIGLSHIRATNRALFANGGPKLDSVRQGPLGDCYFLATLGALIDRDPGAVSQFVRQDRDRSYFVRFPDGEPVRVRTLSDAEIALGSYAEGQGVWLNVLEKAYGELVQRSLVRRGIREDAIDALADGGHATSDMSLFTGCDSALLQFRPDDPSAAPSDVRVDGYLPRVREVLTENMRRRFLTTCGTADADTPPGIAKGHLYAVLGFDPETDTVRIWNPWGTGFTPQGKPGLKNGYPMRHGHFSVPLADFIRIFSSVFSQTDRPASLF